MEALKYENLARSLFQTGRGDDPLGVLAEASEWDDLLSKTFSPRNQAMVWCLLCRLRNAYLDGNTDQRGNFLKTYKQEEKIWKAKSNDELIKVLEWANSIAEELQISEFPYISYRPTNIK
ncbi:hypothetical protein [Sphingobacterium sp. LRF_L2]|uniref:hypothetical protein n=1 Tax=Sphingobacterium sp. LRF_L2 TaxID=3369421 RepID=UPI003F628A96